MKWGSRNHFPFTCPHIFYSHINFYRNLFSLYNFLNTLAFSSSSDCWIHTIIIIMITIIITTGIDLRVVYFVKGNTLFINEWSTLAPFIEITAYLCMWSSPSSLLSPLFQRCVFAVLYARITQLKNIILTRIEVHGTKLRFKVFHTNMHTLKYTHPK